MNKKNKKKSSWGTIAAAIFVVIFVLFFEDRDNAPTNNERSTNSTTAPRLSKALIIKGKCVSVTDGDTLGIKPSDGSRRMTVRVLGIDTLETYNEQKLKQLSKKFNISPAVAKRLGNEAKGFANRLCYNKPVSLVFPLGRAHKDPYGRYLCYVEVSGKDLSRNLLEAGLAEARREPHARKSMYQALADKARKDKVGIYKYL